MMKLAIAQMVFGALVALSSCFIIVGWLTTEFALPVPEGSGYHVQLLVKAGPVQIIAHLSVFLVLVLGLLVFGCGIAQFLKARKVRIRHEATP